MKKRYNIALMFAVICATSLYLLGTETGMQNASTEVLADKASPEAKPANETEAESTEEKTAEQVAGANDEQPQPELPAIEFEAPFPNRVALFQAPKRQGRGSVKQKGQSESSIELLGFVDVDGPRVALSIDGLVTTAAEGDKYFGIEVISIQPPAVVLQRGRQRWQATFDN